ncbi:MAG: hypothetical protein B7733_05695 [Myxococcales bacterium FL481]|nr:MAG: hypothetical protein B7733_05695 [Myxococcales bacterium FL481]
MAIDFQPFPKIPRLYREVVITEKIDGTNACVIVDEDGRVRAGSKNREIFPERLAGKGADNYGFAEWVSQNEEELRGLGAGVHHGEWYGRGIQRGYGLDHRRFALFNVSRFYHAGARPTCCGVVPMIYGKAVPLGGASDYVRNALDDLREFGSQAVKGWERPEGIIIYHRQSKQLFKVTLDGDGHKEQRNA